jgi:hypothetical protein
MHINSHIAGKNMDNSDGFGQLAIQNEGFSESSVNNQFKKLSNFLLTNSGLSSTIKRLQLAVSSQEARIQRMAEAGMSLQIEKVDLYKKIQQHTEVNLVFMNQVEGLMAQLKEFENLKATLKY